jgi:CheY-like chemotaxis protein
MSLGQDLAPHLPFLRRYARALTGTQGHGDAFVRATLEAIVASPGDFPRDVDPRLGLYRTFHAIWSSANIEDDPNGTDADDPESIAKARLARITPLSRQALLLTAMEGFTAEDAGYLIGASPEEVEALVTEALSEIERQTRAEVLIIEDEPIIAMDIETIVRDLGHTVTGVAVTRDEAVAQAMARRPGLVLADIQLADDSSGIDAVKDILAEFQVPVIFITAFPGAPADRRAAGADLPHHQAVPALDGEGGDRPGPVLRHGYDSGLRGNRRRQRALPNCNEWNFREGIKRA